MIVEVLNSFKVTDGKVYIGGTTIEVDRFGALNPDVQKELIKKSGFFRLIDGALPTAEPPKKVEETVEETPPETKEVEPVIEEVEETEPPPEESTEEGPKKTLPRKEK